MRISGIDVSDVASFFIHRAAQKTADQVAKDEEKARAQVDISTRRW